MEYKVLCKVIDSRNNELLMTTFPNHDSVVNKVGEFELSVHSLRT